MLISTKGRYALRVMVDLAEHSTDGFIPLKMIAARQNISEKYLENIIKLLVKAKLLTGVRGKGGGYRLTKAPEQYTVGDILRIRRIRWRPSPVWSQARRRAPGRRSAARFPCGRGWTKSSTIIWISSRSPI